MSHLNHLTAILLSCIFIVSCSDDDTGVVSPPLDNLIGTWNITAVFCNDGDISLDGGITTAGTFTQSGKDIVYQIHFLEDGTFTSEGDVTFEINLKFLSLENTIEEKREDWLGSGTWERLDNNLITDTDNDQDVTSSEIIFEDENRIELKSNIVEEATIQGINTTNSCTLFYTLER